MYRHLYPETSLHRWKPYLITNSYDALLTSRRPTTLQIMVGSGFQNLLEEIFAVYFSESNTHPPGMSMRPYKTRLQRKGKRISNSGAYSVQVQSLELCTYPTLLGWDSTAHDKRTRSQSGHFFRAVIPKNKQIAKTVRHDFRSFNTQSMRKRWSETEGQWILIHSTAWKESLGESHYTW